MDISKLTKGEQIIGVAAIVFIISTFLPWFTVEAEGFGGALSEGANGWDVGFLWARFPALIALVMLVAVVLDKLTEVQLPDLPVTWGQLHLGLGALVALLVLLKLLIGEDAGLSGAEAAFLDELGISISRAWGIFVALLAAIALAVGGFFKFQEEKAGVGGAATPPTSF